MYAREKPSEEPLEVRIKKYYPSNVELLVENPKDGKTVVIEIALSELVDMASACNEAFRNEIDHFRWLLQRRRSLDETVRVSLITIPRPRSHPPAPPNPSPRRSTRRGTPFEGFVRAAPVQSPSAVVLFQVAVLLYYPASLHGLPIAVVNHNRAPALDAGQPCPRVPNAVHLGVGAVEMEQLDALIQEHHRCSGRVTGK